MQNLELAYLAVAYGMAGIMFYVGRHRTFPTLSHIALHRNLTRQVFFWGLTISGLIFAFLMYGWAVPHFSLETGTQVLIGVLIACAVLTGLFPVEGGRFSRAHLIFGSSLGVCMFILIVTLAFTSTVHDVARFIDALLAGGMVVLLVTSARAKQRDYLLYEKIFFALWHAAIFATVYLG